MIQEFVDAFMASKQQLRDKFSEKNPEYIDIVRAVISVMPGGYGQPDAEIVHEIDDGDYQGTLVYVIGAKGYQPYDYWYVRVCYGSCSGCDTLKSIMSDGDYGEHPNSNQVDQYMTLALHVVQGLKKMGGEAV